MYYLRLEYQRLKVVTPGYKLESTIADRSSKRKTAAKCSRKNAVFNPLGLVRNAPRHSASRHCVLGIEFSSTPTA